jgi:hypothetical protein
MIRIGEMVGRNRPAKPKTTAMKKFILITLSTATIALGSMSCSKTYNCHCVYKTNGTVSHEDDNKINEGKKSKSEAKCNEMDNSTTTTLNGTTFVNTTECELQ